QAGPGHHGRPVPAPDRAPPTARALLAPRGVRRAGPGRHGDGLRPRGRRPAGAQLVPRRRARPAAPARRRSARGDRALGCRGPVFPLKDNITTERPALVTYALIIINVFVYFFLQKKTGIDINGNNLNQDQLVRYSAIPYEFTHWGK